MKCPMQKMKTKDIDLNNCEVEIVELQDCIEAECAWWFGDKDYTGCVVHILLRKLSRLNVSVAR